LGFLQRNRRLDSYAAAAANITQVNVDAYVAELTARVRSWTVFTYIGTLRRAAKLLAPTTDFSWLYEIERDLALLKVPRSKYGRFVATGQLLQAGLTLIVEAQAFGNPDRVRARGVRNGLMIALLALCPIRVANFASLEIGSTFKEIDGNWWIALPSFATKARRADERIVPPILSEHIEFYLNHSRPVLLQANTTTGALWISSTTGVPMSSYSVRKTISQLTLETVGVSVSPHLFRTAAASTAAAYCGNIPHLASALLGHTDPRVTEEHYNRATSISASKFYAAITSSLLQNVDS
jgi:integrase